MFLLSCRFCVSILIFILISVPSSSINAFASSQVISSLSSSYCACSLLHTCSSSLHTLFPKRMPTVTLERIQDVLPGVLHWTIKLVLHDISKPQQSISSTKRYQRLVFADGSGQKVMATIFDSVITKFAKVFVLFSTYRISNAKITPLADRYNKFGYPYQWIITARTAVSRELVTAIPSSSMDLNMSSLADLHCDPNEDDLKDVLVIVIDKLPARTLVTSGKQHTIREFVIVGEEKKVLILSLWNNVASSEGQVIDSSSEEMPIIRATRLSVSSYYTLSLSSTPTTVITVNPQIAEAERLRTWCANNMAFIATALAKKDYLVHGNSFESTIDEDICPLASVVAVSDIDKFVVRVRSRITCVDQSFFYIACNHCFSGVDAESGHSYTCASCNESVLASPRAKLLLNIYDASGELDVIVFGDSVANIIQLDSTLTMGLQNSGGHLDIANVNLALAATTFLMRLKRKNFTMRNITHTQFVVTSLQLDDGNNRLPLDITSSRPNLPVVDCTSSDISSSPT